MIRINDITDPVKRAKIQRAVDEYLGAGGSPAAATRDTEAGEPEKPTGLSDRPACPSRRIQQHSKSKLTQLEQQALEWLKRGYQTDYYLRPHAIRFELANGCLYTPDIIGQPTPYLPEPTQYTTERKMRAWEVKGKQAWDDSIVKLKVAAREWPSIRFTLIWREGKHGPWLEQEVLP